MSIFIEQANFICSMLLLLVGLFGILLSSNLMKKLLGLVIFQNAIFLLFISISYVKGGKAPIISQIIEQEQNSPILYTNPIPHVLMLTAIVVSLAVTAVGIALVIQIKNKNEDNK